MEYQEFMNQQRSKELDNFYATFLKDNIIQKMQETVNGQVMMDIITKIVQSSKEQFLRNVSKEIEKVKHQNQTLKQKNSLLIAQHEQKIKQLSAKVKKQCQMNIKSQTQQLIKIKNRLIEILGQQQIILAVRNIISENKILHSSLSYRQEYIDKLQRQLKEQKQKEISLARQLQQSGTQLKNATIDKNQSKQTHNREKSDLQNQLCNIQKQLKQKIEQLSIKDDKLIEKEKYILKLEENDRNCNLIMQQYKQTIEKKTKKLENLQTQVKKIKQQNQTLNNSNKKLQYSLNTLSSQNSALILDQAKNQEITNLLKSNLSTFNQQNKQERIDLEDRNRKQYLRTQMIIKQLRQENQYLRTKMEELFSQKEQVETLIVQIKNKYQSEIANIKNIHKASINQRDKQQQQELLNMKKQIQQLTYQLNIIKNNEASVNQLKEDLNKSQRLVAQLRASLNNIQNQRKFFFKNISSSTICPNNQQQRSAIMLALSHKQLKKVKSQLYALKHQFSTQLINLKNSIKRQLLKCINKVIEWKTKCLLCQHNNNFTHSQASCYSFRDNLETFYNGKAATINYKDINKKTIKKSLQKLYHKYSVLQGQTNTFKKHLKQAIQPSFNS